VGRDVFITGASGYMGRRLSDALAARGHRVRGLVRPGSENRLGSSVQAVTGDALRAESFASAVSPNDTLVHLVGTPHPSPWKAEEFRRVDLPSILASVAACRERGVGHLVYVSVPQPSPIMKTYVAVRAEGEAAIRAAGLTATVIRPLYVLGPGHRWPLILVPVYWIAERVPSMREGALRLGLVTIDQMIATMVRAVEEPPQAGTIRVVGARDIRSSRA
jgi:nucleoside-diphosphate-sugar epimerase